ncbi:SDR family oxidoreductase [Schleiferia thermophila]|jgi:short-subunit dehydrogenase|uniref:Short-subunit dehydrogenase n=1 Tax=Schleiferia thermophila TaxID=884107 RepID=A0A369A3B3_9FLAO|nr:SDR family oxidoreductase [Schleiferia thermophila]KFD38557.1 hypothetical protein AT05_09880 [Schleiferia thermophila str. Yellowstone]RCX03643.1 short-subunit dehydrogenase [Schleiferia thermophila]GCD79877.1 oxidoreductase [Schleiferia thermophila]
MNKNVIITGHSKGIGKCIVDKLLETENFSITGISRTVVGNIKIREISCDLSNINESKKLCRMLSDMDAHILILNAGANVIKPAESYSLEEIAEIEILNFISPSLLIKTFLPKLIKNKGHVIVIGSYSGLEVKKWNNYYGAAKAGLHHLTRNLFEQYRNSGLKTTLIIPDIVNSGFYSKSEVNPVNDPIFSIQPEELGKLVLELLENATDYIPFEIVVRPQRFRLDKKLPKPD